MNSACLHFGRTCALSLVVAAFTSPALALDPIYRETFSTGLNNWAGGSSPTLVTSGGPGGASDAYLRITSSPAIGNGNLATFNRSAAWTGNYAGNFAAGETLIIGVEAELANFGSTPLDIRAIFFNTDDNRVSTLDVASVPADGVWRRYMWRFSPVFTSGLTTVRGTQTITQTMSNVTQLMFRHNVSPAAGGDDVAGTLGLDNIMLIEFIPTPSAAAVLGVGALVLGRRRR